MKTAGAAGFLRRLRPTPLALAAILGGTAVHVFAIVMVRFPDSAEPPASAVPMPFLRWVDDTMDDEPVREQARLFDSAPFFVPTRWNVASDIDGMASLEEQTVLYSAFPADLLIDRTEAPMVGLLERFRPSVPDLLRDLAILRSTESFAATEESASPIEARPVRLLVEPVARGTAGSDEWRMDLPTDLAAAVPGGLWETPVFFLDFTVTGLVGKPVLARGSGNRELDARLLEHLAEPSVTRRFGAGYYRVTLVP